MNFLAKFSSLKGVFLSLLLTKSELHPNFVDEIKARGAACPSMVKLDIKRARLEETDPESNDDPEAVADDPAAAGNDPEANDGDDEGDEDNADPGPDENSLMYDPRYEKRNGVKIYGIIISEDWAWLFRLMKIEAVSAESVRRDLNKRVKGDTCTLYIDSFGGSVIEAGKIRSALAEWRDAKSGRQIVARVEGAAISAGASVMVIANSITMDSQSLIGLHVPILGLQGSAETHRRAAGLLDSILDAECRLFAKRMRMKPANIAARMKAGLDEIWWMAAHEAKSAGLCDDVIGLDGDSDGDDDPDEDEPTDTPPDNGGDSGGDDPNMDGGETGEPGESDPDSNAQPTNGPGDDPSRQAGDEGEGDASAGTPPSPTNENENEEPGDDDAAGRRRAVEARMLLNRNRN